jgi:hypothetical protein
VAAVEQGADALGIDPKGRHLLPQPLAEGGISPLELDMAQLPHQQQHQLPFLQVREAELETSPRSCGPMTSLIHLHGAFSASLLTSC